MNLEKTSTEDQIIPGYEFDGITEYDNPCPKWLMYIFYLTMFFAVYYFGYAVGKSKGPSNSQKTITEELQKTQTMQPSISESEITALLQDPAALAKGEELFAAKCASCHGAHGEGLIGPNLVDNYWLHGTGGIRDIAKVIRVGVPDTGMAAWKNRISEENIRKIAAYIKSLKGTQPENAKEPEGKLIEE